MAIAALVLPAGCSSFRMSTKVPTGLMIQAQSNQAQSEYERAMLQGYSATKERNYSAALKYFQQALRERPGDRYARIAISNIESYISREQQFGKKKKRYLIYIPASIGKPTRIVPAGTRGASLPQQIETAFGIAINNGQIAEETMRTNRVNTSVNTNIQETQETVQAGAAVDGSRVNQSSSQTSRQSGAANQSSSQTGRPSRSVGAADFKRRTCTQRSQAVTALAPFMQENQLTTAAHPTLFFYIPQTYTQTLQFVVLDEDSKPIYRGTFNTPGEPGIVSLSLPKNSTAPELKVGKTYRWGLLSECGVVETNSSSRTNRSLLVAQGLIQRVEPSSKVKLELATANQRERAAIYALSGFLPDALANLGRLRQERPTDAELKTDWKDLLRSAGLEEITEAPLVNCCKN